MKTTIRGIYSGIVGNAKKNFRTLFRTLAALFEVSLLLFWLRNEIKKASIGLLSRLPSFVPGTGIEPVRPRGHRILSPACLPIPPPRQKKINR